MDISIDGLRTLRAVLEHGTFEAAATELHVTPSAVSQRIKAMEVAVGRVLVQRTKPAIATDDGEVLIRLAKQWELLTAEAGVELIGDTPDSERPRPIHIPIGGNSDSLATWLLPALARIHREHPVVVEVLRDDESRNSEFLRSGKALAAITSDPIAIRGCTVIPLGVMRYVPVATPEFLRKWMPDGPTSDTLSRAPMVSYDRNDHIQRTVLRAYSSQASEPPTIYIPASVEYHRAVEMGMGWGVVPHAQIADALDAGRVVRFLDPDNPDPDHDVPLYWQYWKLSSPLLDAVTAGIVAAARAELLPLQ
ncbi:MULTISPECIES: LysR family transcriptional regulator ArgP [unclassified Gordonia (in: high G+C Gram-positive bacteria)]|uniref:LysR family transcriptional regulator ArgP n=1 Tax=unclassified Gordonia (in: high G+C Gram-positive bacteria) TaxID=2657482 RepID=UPI001F110317|nr:LysR family transcriptional regulator ArgP [Gordonia sp. ABSL49_1]MCH5641166.1 LysR family transcriptional regulator ArgP [Gordonia sp. ABSL49_1]